MQALLETRDLTVVYGGVRANDQVNVHVDEGELLGLIGPNGAGKTTFIDAITGFAPITHGQVLLAGEDVTAWSPHRRARAGPGPPRPPSAVVVVLPSLRRLSDVAPTRVGGGGSP